MDDARLVAASAIALAVTLFAIFWLRPLARRLGLTDRPDGRKRHRGRVPLVGGLCFFLGTVVGLLYLGYVDRFVASLLVPCALIVLTGAVDDLHDLSVRARLIVQTCAAGMVVAATGVYLDHTGHVFGVGIQLGVLGIPVTIIAVIGLINAFNMLDGIDGLAASLAMVSIGAIMLFASAGWSSLGVLLLLQVLFASLIPYLCVNLGWPDGRKIFMGDAGSTLIGFLLGWSLIFLSHRGVAKLAPIDALWCVALPVMDTLAVMFRRLRNRISPFKPGRQHLHHLLQDTGCSPRTVLAVIVMASGGLTLIGYGLRNAPEPVSGAVFLVLLTAYVFRFQRGLDWVCAKVGERPAMIVVATLDAHAPHPMREEMAIPTPSQRTTLRTLCVMASSPDAIRIAPIARQLARDARFDAKVCVAAQTDQVPSQVLNLFGLHPDMQLRGSARPGQDDDVTSMTLGGMKRVLNQFKPDVIVVPSGTSTTLATTLAAFYQQIPVVCIEPDGHARNGAQHRFDEANRKITCTLASLHLSPNESATRHLLAEGVPADRIVLTGSTAMGTLRAAVERIRQDPILGGHLAQCFGFLRAGSPLLLMADRESLRFASAVTGEVQVSDPGLSGAEEFRANSRFEATCRALRRIAMHRPDVDIVYPIAARLGAMRKTRDLLRACPNVHLVAPPDYLGFAFLLDRAYLVLADSSELATEVGALQKAVVQLQSDAIRAAGEVQGAGPVAVNEHSIASAVWDLLDDREARDVLSQVAGASTARRDACECAVEALADLRRQPIVATRASPGRITDPAIKALRHAS